jgi:AhpD family alkylhydroperoxidase
MIILALSYLQISLSQRRKAEMSGERLRSYEIAPAGMKAVCGVEAYIQKCGLEHSLIELVKMRASQINGCVFCLDMHSKDARRRGESEQRLYLLDAWTESPLYSPRERAALAWTEAVTRIDETRAPTPYMMPCAPISPTRRLST